MPLPSDFYDEGVNYRIRICLKVDENPLVGLLSGSRIHTCDDCGAAIWVKEDMPVPEASLPITGDLNLCQECGRRAVEGVSPAKTEWLGPRPPGWD